MTWWLINSARLSSEKAAIADLEARYDWLNIGRWYADTDLAMCVDFRIANGDEDFAFRMLYPGVFPDAPPLIFTEDNSRISLHQYGADGELCLEHRPDNWDAAITGADMIASCQRLLAEERPKEGEILHARSAHVSSLGRDLRNKHFRFLATENDLLILNQLPEREPIEFGLLDKQEASVFISSLSYLGSKDAPISVSELLLPKGRTPQTGQVVRIPDSGSINNLTADELRAYLEAKNLHDLSRTLIDADTFEHLLIGDEENWTLYCIYGEMSDRKVVNYTTLKIPSAKQRLPEKYAALKSKMVGIVGCGSAGSKIAASLCRCGVGRFFLIDEDVFFPGNIVRNELDLNDIGVHKSHALRERILKINPNVDVRALRIALGGQESASVMAGALETLGECDVLIDATAEPTAFNMVASIATRQKKPMIWLEIFAGGIGGIVARARPEIDPIPLAARSQIAAWCNEQDVDWIRPEDGDRYDGESANGTPLIADDAEISIIAAHAVRYATDILAATNSSNFPVSAYVIGLSSEWVFSEPFDTRPIELRLDGEWGESIDAVSPESLIALLKEHLVSSEGENGTNTTK